MKNLFSAVLWAVMMLFSVMSTPGAAAETERSWVKMNRDRFEDTPASAAEQCARMAKKPGSGVSLLNCEVLESKLEEGACLQLDVADGIRFDLMSTYEGGRPTIVGPMIKRLGREDQAMVCDIQDGVTAYFFIGEKRSCGNLAVVVERPEVVEGEIDEASLNQVSTTPAEKKCRWVKGPTAVSTGSVSTTLMPTGISTFCGPVIMIGGGVVTTELPQSSFTSSRRVCDD